MLCISSCVHYFGKRRPTLRQQYVSSECLRLGALELYLWVARRHEKLTYRYQRQSTWLQSSSSFHKYYESLK